MTSSPFHAGELDAQQRWGNPELWTEARIGQLIWNSIPEPIHARIEAAPFFFLATSSSDGRCDCSFKGGGPGLVKVLTPSRLAFPPFEARVQGAGLAPPLWSRPTLLPKPQNEFLPYRRQRRVDQQMQCALPDVPARPDRE